MGHLERDLQWLRPLILESNTWDYCVVWKLSDRDSSRFVEWVGCCCNGSKNDKEIGTKKGIKIEENVRIRECRDVNFVHLANTKSCEALSRLPPFMSLNCSVHGEVLISSRPRWFNIASAPDSEELEGTRVLIPVVGGLVELFSTQHIPENESIIEFIRAQFNSSETETISNSSITVDTINEPYIDQLLDKTSDTCLSTLNEFTVFPMNLPLIPISGSSTASPDSTPQTQKTEKKQCKSKNLLTERKRRKRISDGMLTLRSIVPKITKMHKAATLTDAIEYIMELENEAKKLLEELEEEDSNNLNDLNASCLNREVMDPRGAVNLNEKQLISRVSESPKIQVEVEVNQLGSGKYLVRVVSQKNPGVFTKLVEALSSMDVLIEDVNSTMCNYTTSTNFIVQANNNDVNENGLRESLMQLDI